MCGKSMSISAGGTASEGECADRATYTPSEEGTSGAAKGGVVSGKGERIQARKKGVRPAVGR